MPQHLSGSQKVSTSTNSDYVNQWLRKVSHIECFVFSNWQGLPKFLLEAAGFLHFECDGMFQPFMCEELSEEVGFYLHVWTLRYVSQASLRE